MVFRDSMAYDANGMLAKVFRFSINGGDDLPLYSVRSLTYDGQDQLIESNTEFTRQTDYNPRKVYHWKDGNVIKEDHYWNGTDISLEFYITYDNMKALKANSMIGFQQTEVHTKNNVVSVDWTDHTGLYDTACKPCTTTYVYNTQELPIAISTNWGYGASIRYRQLQEQPGF